MLSTPGKAGKISTIVRPASGTARQNLLICGYLSSLLYIGLNIITPILYPGYDVVSQTVSELSAIDAPTRPLWVGSIIFYSILIIAFGFGVRQSGNKTLRIVGALIIAQAVIGLFWPPMHQRDVLVAGGGTLTDTLHIAFTFITVPLMVLTIVFGAFAFGPGFRWYSFITLALLLGTGVITGIDGPKISTGQPTPWIGIWERITIGVHIIWIMVLASKLLRFPYSVK